MGSSPDRGADVGSADPAWDGDEIELEDGEVRWPLLAKVGVTLAVLTVVGVVVAALVAAFVVGPRDEDEGRRDQVPAGAVGEWSGPDPGQAVGAALV